MYNCLKISAALLGGLFFCLSVSAQTVQPINPETLFNNPNYAHVVVTSGGKTIYVSGQVAQDKSGALVGKGNFRAQAVQALENVRLALAAAGASVKDIVKINTYLTDMSNLNSYREIRLEFLKDLPVKPASTTVEVSELFQPGYLLEVEVTAVIN